MIKKIIISGILIFFNICLLVGQVNNLGNPFIINYQKKIYQGGTQNWQIVQTDNGLMYFANNEGLLEFNGHDWTIFPIENKTIVRSIAKGNKDKIYAGGQDEFGYYQPNQKGNLAFHTLKEKIPPQYRNFEDVWNIFVHNEDVYFRASNRIYHFSNDETVQVYDTGNPIGFLGMNQDRIFVHDLSTGLLELKDGEFKLISNHENLNQNPIHSVIDWTSDSLLFTSLKNGIFYLTDSTFSEWRTKHDSFLKKNRIYIASKLGDQQLAIGTSTDGLLILNKNRKAVQWLSKKHGLQNKNVLSLFTDHGQNLWLGLDNGIDYIKTSSPFSAIYPDGDLEGTAYTVKIQGEDIYFGTSSGLYHAPRKTYFNPLLENPFNLIDQTQGQVWGLEKIDNKLLLGHHEGSFVIQDRTINKISQINGAWTFIPFEGQPDYMISGTYAGISIFKKNQEGDWTFIKELDGLKESCRIIAQDPQGFFWVAHPYRGVYKIHIDPEQAKITEQKLYSIDQGHPRNVFKINNEVVFVAQKGIVKYDAATDKFVPYAAYNEILGADSQIKRLVEAPNGNIWYISDKDVGVLKIEDRGLKKTFHKQVFPELKGQLVGGFEFIYPYDEYNVFFGAEKGFIHYNPKKLIIEDHLTAILTQVQVLHKKDSVIYMGHTPTKNENTLDYQYFPSDWNDFIFDFAAPWYTNLEHIEYQYYLEGLEREWLNWTDTPQKGYTNLSPGDYTFQLKARNANGQESPIVSYAFSIQPPWYASVVAYAFYGLLFLIILGSIIWIPQRKFKEEIGQIEEEQKRQKAIHEQELAATEAALIQVKNETLQNQIDFKNKELVSATMHLVQKGELIGKIGQKLDQISKDSKNPQTIKEIKQVIRLLHHDQLLDEDWQQFTSHFDQVHSNFLQRLRDKYPNLTPKDYRLCAYLRMNLSTKEIALMINISVRGVEISRYRLRKKLELDNTVNLNEFMISF